MSKFKIITNDTKIKQMNSMIGYIKKKIKEAEIADRDIDEELFYACKTCGHQFYLFMKEYLEEEN